MNKYWHTVPTLKSVDSKSFTHENKCVHVAATTPDRRRATEHLSSPVLIPLSHVQSRLVCFFTASVNTGNNWRISGKTLSRWMCHIPGGKCNRFHDLWQHLPVSLSDATRRRNTERPLQLQHWQHNLSGGSHNKLALNQPARGLWLRPGAAPRSDWAWAEVPACRWSRVWFTANRWRKKKRKKRRVSVLERCVVTT